MRKFFIILIALMLVSILSINVYAMEIDEVITQMNGVQKRDTSLGNDEGIMAVINDVIGLLQLAGTGIAVVTVTILGAKYMLSSVDQKAEIKNKAMPLVIGCIILFAAVNLVAIVANFTNDVLAS